MKIFPLTVLLLKKGNLMGKLKLAIIIDFTANLKSKYLEWLHLLPAYSQ
jgi:hypothetical protein